MDIEQRLAAIEARNARVDRDKMWERSEQRRACIALITYCVASIIFLTVLPNEQWYLTACVPVVGYLLSTLALPLLRQHWEKNQS